MNCLGIESTAHTCTLGVVDSEGNILANIKDMFKPPKGYGIEPSKAREHHERVSDNLIEKALSKADIEKPDLIAYSAGPGLPPSLLAGLNKTKELSKRWNVPVVEVNHCVAHLEIGRMVSGFKDPVMLYVSGGNTQVIAFQNGKYRVFGETEDIGVGNFLDSFGRAAGFDFPAGPKIEALAKKSKNYIELPYSVKGMDISFSGMQTRLKRLLKKEKLEDLCFSLQETAFAMLVEISERAMAHTNKKELILTGGVAANKRLQEMCKIMCKERGAKFKPLPIPLAGDNGAMIAWTGILSKGLSKKKNLDIYPKWRTDEVNVIWRK